MIESRLGLHFPESRLGDLQRGLTAATREFGFTEAGQCAEWLLSSTLSNSQISTLAGCLTIGETYFFRDKRVFEILETSIVPEMIRAKRGRQQNIRIWSAGCATGEEPYSLAMMLAGMLPDIEEWNISILATDIAPGSLKKAVEGVYGEWSFRETPKWVKDRWFEARDRHFAVAPRIRRMVTFASLNLADDGYPATAMATDAMDIIFCRNVLMYFSRERAIAILENLARCLVHQGWLVISPVDAPGPRLPALLYPVTFPGAIFYRKGKEEIRGVLPSAGIAPRSSDPPPAVRKTVRPAETAQSFSKKQLKEQQPEVPGDSLAAPDAMAGQARLLANQGRLGDAMALCEAAIQKDKLNSALHYLQATILQETELFMEAEAALKRAIYIDQDFAVAHFLLGHLLQRRGRNREAGKHLEKAGSLLKAYAPNDIPPESEGISAGRLIELINGMKGRMHEQQAH